MISFNYQTDFNHLDTSRYISWLNMVASSEQETIGSLDYVFCSDDYLHNINLEFLSHDTLTDIITFDYSQDGLLNGEIYISVDRVKDNAVRFRESEDEELRRVIVHGLLHLIGYSDKSDVEKTIMRAKELDKMKLFHVEQGRDV